MDLLGDSSEELWAESESDSNLLVLNMESPSYKCCLGLRGCGLQDLLTRCPSSTLLPFFFLGFLIKTE